MDLSQRSSLRGLFFIRTQCCHSKAIGQANRNNYMAPTQRAVEDISNVV